MFDRYIALGDSLSIDLYPALDVMEHGDPAFQGAPPRGLGAAALLHRNDDGRWPEFAGRDLASRHPGIAFRSLHEYRSPTASDGDHFATDSATTVGVLAYQLSRVPPSDERTLFTVTVGTYDVVQMMGAPNPPVTLVEGMLQRVARLAQTIAHRRPNAAVLLTTVVDPSDGSGTLGAEDPFAREQRWIAEYNARLAEALADQPQVRLVDAHAHFLGHGASAAEGDRWFWRGSPIKLGARGASELRRLWLEALGI